MSPAEVESRASTAVSTNCSRRREMTLARLSELVGVSVVNLSILKNDRARAIRFSTLAAICDALDCEVGDLLVRQDS